MSATDITPAIGLSRQAGWNQLRGDWVRLLTCNPTGCFVAICDGQLAGTVTTTRYGRDLGWIGMMLVDPGFRRRGIATALIRQSVDYLKSESVRCIKLDATPAGELVYRKLGFECEWRFHRWSLEHCGAKAQNKLSSTSSQLPAHTLELDQKAFGTDRSVILKLIGEDSRIYSVRHGFGMLRQGFLAPYLGPVCATTPTVARAIISELCQPADHTVLWDVPTPNSNAVRIARSLGFSPVRDLTRMSLGGKRSNPDMQLQYALADPAAG